MCGEVAIVVLAVYSYVDQWLHLRRHRTIGSFSIMITAIVVVSNVLKLFYWFIDHYRFNLFVQGILLIVVNVPHVAPSC